MPYFVFCAHDRAGAEEARARVRESHRAYIRIAQEGCRCVAGGPLTDEAGAYMNGTLLIFEARDREAVERFVANDPYTSADIFARRDIWRWNWGLGTPANMERST